MERIINTGINTSGNSKYSSFTSEILKNSASIPVMTPDIAEKNTIIRDKNIIELASMILPSDDDYLPSVLELSKQSDEPIQINRYGDDGIIEMYPYQGEVQASAGSNKILLLLGALVAAGLIVKNAIIKK